MIAKAKAVGITILRVSNIPVEILVNGFKNVGGCYFKISDTRINPNHTMYLEC